MDSIEQFQLADIINELANSIQTYSASVPSPSASLNVVRSSPTRLIELVDFDDFTSFWDLWTPDVWTLLLFFVIAVAVKLLFEIGLNKKAVRRTQEALREKWGGCEVDEEIARGILKKPLSYIIGWALTITLETACFVLQCYCWRLWRIDEQPLRSEDMHVILALIKILLIGYAADLLLLEKGYDIYLHHCFSFILLFVGQATLFTTRNSVFPRLANWMICQATLAFPLYFGLGLVQVERYLHVQGHKPELQRQALRYSYRFLRFMTWIYVPQKLVPAIFCLYWLGQMWDDVKTSAWGVVWLVCATITVPLLLLLQVFVLSDSVAAMTSYIGYKVHGGSLPSKRGPIARFVSRLGNTRRQNRARGISSAEQEVKRKDADERATNASSKSSTPLFFVNLAEDAGRKGSVASSL